MGLRLVSSSDDSALAIRDHLLPLVRERGTLELQRDSVRLVTLEIDLWTIHHWTPFNELSSGEASSPGYRHAIERQRGRQDLSYGLEVWRGERLLCLLWADDGAFEVISFVRGAWEADALALRPAGT
jgi:hypothetical protein